jgi:hypothetical protein
MSELLKNIQRKSKQPARQSIVDLWGNEVKEENVHKELWWGMPAFSMEDATPFRTIKVHFLTEADRIEFCQKMNIPIPGNPHAAAWFPAQTQLRREEYTWIGPKVSSKYPIFIPSKGRWDCQTTGKALDEMGCDYFFVVEETEEKQYKEFLGPEKVLVLPFHDLGQGSIPARNWIWEYAKAHGHAKHWLLDDNILSFARCHCNRRIRCRTGVFFRIIEDFSDRYDNLAFSGPHLDNFVRDRQPILPFVLNSRVYSCILINTDLPYRWRGKYNEDTDLCLRALKDGWATVLFRALAMKKANTAFSKGGGMKGGNTDNVYNTKDYRRKFAESLKQQHPDCVEVVWKFNRWHHQVDYSKFKNNQLVLKPGITPTGTTEEYGMDLVRNLP